MKIVGVVSSAHGEGNSATLLREVLAGARERGAETVELFLPQLDIGYCEGCMYCMANGRCRKEDDFERIRSMLVDADGIVFSTPVYADAPSARLKTLIDRLGLFESMTASVFRGKYFVAIATAKSSGAKRTTKYLTDVAEGPIFGKAYVTGTLEATLRGTATASGDPSLAAKARRLGAKMVDEHTCGKKHPARSIVSRFVIDTFVRPAIAKSIFEFRDKGMGGVYANLKGRKLIA